MQDSMLHLKRVQGSRIFGRACVQHLVWNALIRLMFAPISEMFVLVCPPVDAPLPLHCVYTIRGLVKRQGIEFVPGLLAEQSYPPLSCYCTSETAGSSGWLVHVLLRLLTVHLQAWSTIPQTPPPDSAGRLSSGAHPIDQTTIGCRFGSWGQGFDSRFWAIPILESRFHADLRPSDAKFG